ncbi:acyl-CoA thioesterase [Hymenobacter sp. 15J16-1T3B]|uniref:acyl-CoA thioesterase n=1 Tax=Hymenobacter sp. 15J16-1T3B TaxID=2886941 RepID=UPI001D10DF78|nr:thioesterase family protein [Hymenobacter sp. 15J16-1T3B]MCC3160276.1 acyl-CoA thioesterase [Hymenobacter sp. 15J16-1T3B]
MTMPTPDIPAFRFSRPVTVVASHIDELNHVNNVQYVQWIQDIAGAHWLTAYPEGEREQYVWVVQEHHVRYRKSALLGDELRLTTWIGEFKGATSQRFTRIERLADGALLCEAETKWVLLDPQTQRPKRVEASVVERLWGPVGA